MIKECHRHIQRIDIRQREVGGWRDNEKFKIKISGGKNLRLFLVHPEFGVIEL